MCVIMSMNVLMPSWSYLLLMSNVLFIHSLDRIAVRAPTRPGASALPVLPARDETCARFAFEKIHRGRSVIMINPQALRSHPRSPPTLTPLSHTPRTADTSLHDTSQPHTTTHVETV